MIEKESNPIPQNEMQRLLNLSELDLDYRGHEDNFKDLTKLAAKIAGTEISLINLIDSYTQWSIASYGRDTSQTPREDTVCQYTIMTNDALEIPDLSQDERFSSKFYVDGPEGLRYYFGVPLQISFGVNIGALCVLDAESKTLTPDKVELLQIVADMVVKRLKCFNTLNGLKASLSTSKAAQKKVAHDIRGPLAGIIGLSEIMAAHCATGDTEELADLTGMISKSGKSLLDLTDEILTEVGTQKLKENEFNLLVFKQNLESLYGPQAKHKDITLNIKAAEVNGARPFGKDKLIQITGNLISNAIKFTPAGGKIEVEVSLEIYPDHKFLKIIVTDTGIGMDTAAVKKIMMGKGETTVGTMGEKGFGFGLALIYELVASLNGEISIDSKPGAGTKFEVLMPQVL